MEIRSAQFITGVIGSEGLPKLSLPTVAFFGRSNVGKSSLINSLTRLKGLAKANQKPGRTTEINYFLINDAWYFADLPGYGYAKLPPAVRKKLSGYLSWFVAEPRIDLQTAVLIVDAEVGMKDSDHETLALLCAAGHRVVIVANKCDKGRRAEIDRQVRAIKSACAPIPVLRYSTKTDMGRTDLLALLLDQ